MAYVEKYYHTYCDRYGDTYRISLQEQGYDGPAVEVECGPEQFVIEQESPNSLLLGGVCPTRATATFVSDGAFELQELYTGTDRTYLLVRYRNGQLNWQGNIIADGFSQGNWDENRMMLTVRATDNLSTLKGVPFTDQDGENYGNDGDTLKSFLWIIKEGLKKTGFNMNIWTFVDLKPMTQAGTRVYSRYITRESLNQIRIYFDSKTEVDQFISDTSVNDIFSITNGEMSGFVEAITNIQQSTTGLKREVILTFSATVDTFDGYYTVVEIGPPFGTQEGDPLFHTQHDVRVWIRDSNVEGKTYYEARGGAMDTWEVLDAVCRQWNIRVYQNEGHWEAKRINADKLPDDTHEWFVYNSEGTLIDSEDFGGDRLLPCRPTDTDYRIFGSVLSMDRVFKNVIANYRYKYRQEGDVLKNLVDNPNFAGGTNGWTVIRYNNLSPLFSATPYLGSIPVADISSAISIKNIYNNQFIANREIKNEANDIRQVNKGDKISISWWEKIDGFSLSEDNVASVFQFSLWGTKQYGNAEGRGQLYDLVLSRIDGPVIKNIGGEQIAEQTYGASWQQKKSGEEHTRFGAIQQTERGGGVGKGYWRKVTLDIGEVPIDGWVVMEIVGVTPLYKNNKAPIVVSFTPRLYAENRVKIKGLVAQENGPFELKDIYTYFSVTNIQHYTLNITGWQFNKIIDPDNEVVPQIDPFMYPDHQSQLTREFSDTIGEIEVLTGDDYGEYVNDRISGMKWDGIPTQFWDTWDNRFGWSRQGLITAKSVIEMYWKPTRLLQCEIGMKGLHWSSRIQFEELPGLRFVILRGSIGGRDSTFKGVLKEVHDEAETPLPPGGNDGGNTTQADWQPTGIIRCRKDVGGLNTGDVERVETDINRASPTYGQERWVEDGTDTDTCPIGEPVPILWGEQSALDVDGLRTYPFVKEEDVYSVAYSNDGSNRYLRFLHLSSLGTIRNIFYTGGFESISGWEYEADVVIDGYTYKHIRLTWFVGSFDSMEVNFRIN